MFYTHSPQLHSTDAGQALLQCEMIVALATAYGCLDVVRPYLGNVLFQLRRELCTAIYQDPPRWLKVSVALESAPVFCEALIHCAGCWPTCTWPTSISSLSMPLIQLIRSKARWLASLRSEINLDLFVNSMNYDRQQPLKPEEQQIKMQVAYMFHQWLARNIYNYRLEGKEHLKTIYYLMSKGGRAYLTRASVAQALYLEEDDIGYHLGRLKNYISMVVAQLVKNNLMMDAETLGVTHFTCIEVTDQDYPWSISHS